MCYDCKCNLSLEPDNWDTTVSMTQWWQLFTFDSIEDMLEFMNVDKTLPLTQKQQDELTRKRCKIY